MELMAEAMSMAPTAQLQADVIAQEGFSAASFTFPDQVDLAAGRVLSLPFVTDRLTGRQHLAWVGGQSGRTASPEIRLEVTNDLPVRLPAGIMTVRDALTGYVGDAAFPMLAPGEEGSITFGTDEKTEITERLRDAQRAVALEITDAGILLRNQRIREVTYRVEAPEGIDVPLVIEHPDHEGWRTEVDGDDVEVSSEEGEYGQDWLMIEMAPADRASRVITVRSETDIETLYQIETVTSDQVLQWLSRRSLSDPTRDMLTEILRIRRAQQDIEQERGELAAERGLISRDQMRARDMLQALERGTSEYARFLTSVVEAEDRIGEIDDREAELKRQHDQLLSELRNINS